MHFSIGLADVVLMVNKNSGDPELPDLSWTGNSAPVQGVSQRGLLARDEQPSRHRHTQTIHGHRSAAGHVLCYNVMETRRRMVPNRRKDTEAGKIAQEARPVAAAECPGARQTIDYRSYTASQCATPDSFVTVSNQAELDAYETNFGWDGSRVQNLSVNFNPWGTS